MPGPRAATTPANGGTGKGMRLLVAAGGTGGHIYPALAIARACAERLGADPILFVGARGGMEERLVPQAGFALRTLAVGGLVRKRPAEALRGAFQLVSACGGALALLRSFRPDVVLGTGGYAAGPVGLAAGALRVPLVLQEQNAIPGVTNRFLARFAACVAVPYPEARRRFPGGARLVVAGNPVRPEVLGQDPAAARRRLGLPVAGRVVLMFAGSRGSAVFVGLLREFARRLTEGHLLFVSGVDHHPAALRAAGDAGPQVRVVPYLTEVGDGLAAADVVVCRAGAMTLAELAAVGRASVLIPSPHVTHRHQDANAAVFAAAGAALVLEEAGLDGGRLAGAVLGLLGDPARRAAMAAAARGLAQPDGLGRMVEAIAGAAASR